MLVSTTSPFRSLPSTLDRRQATVLDGIRLALEMADLCYARLEQILLNLAQQEALPPQEYRVFPGAFVDAWTFVDTVNRLRDLVRQFPRMRNSTGLRLFFDRTSSIEVMRDVLQHLNNEIAGLAERNESVWGQLGWVATIDPVIASSKLCFLVGGQVTPGTHPFINPLGKPLRYPIDHVQLTLGSQCVEFTRVYESLQKFVEAVEPSLSARI